MQEVKRYAVYKDGKQVCEGCLNDIAAITNINKNYVYYGLSHNCTVKGYTIKHVGSQMISREQHKVKVIKREKPVEVKKTKREEMMDMLKRQLIYCRYDKAYVGQVDPVQFLPDLYDLGVDCKVVERPVIIDRSTVTKRGRKPKAKFEYYLEVVNRAERECQSV